MDCKQAHESINVTSLYFQLSKQISEISLNVITINMIISLQLSFTMIKKGEKQLKSMIK